MPCRSFSNRTTATLKYHATHGALLIKVQHSDSEPALLAVVDYFDVGILRLDLVPKPRHLTARGWSVLRDVV